MLESKEPEPFIVFGAPRIEQDEIDEVVDCLQTGWLGTGPKVAQFESEMQRYKGGWGYPVAVNSCTAALHLSLIASGVGPGDEVITTPMTFCATVNAIIHTGATPVLADIDEATQNICPQMIKQAITPRTRAVVPVHFAGRPCEMDEISKICESQELKLIEDCAHSIESTYHGQHAGTFGHFGCYSFYVTKNIVTGEGGMVIAGNESDASRVKTLALHGMSKDAWKRFSDEGFKHYQVVECGFKYNMMDIQAAIGIHQLRRIEEYWIRRQQIWNFYNQELSDLPIALPPEPAPDTRHAYHLYIVRVPQDSSVTRDQFLNRMTAQNVGVGVHYMSIPEHPFYQENYGWTPDQFPNARDAGRETVSLPISARLSDADLDRVVKAVRAALKG